MMRIEHVDEVLPWIDGREEFVVKRTPDYAAVDYLIGLADHSTIHAAWSCGE